MIETYRHPNTVVVSHFLLIFRRAEKLILVALSVLINMIIRLIFLMIGKSKILIAIKSRKVVF